MHCMRSMSPLWSSVYIMLMSTDDISWPDIDSNLLKSKQTTMRFRMLKTIGFSLHTLVHYLRIIGLLCKENTTQVLQVKEYIL